MCIRGDLYTDRSQAQPRLALVRQDLACPQQDSSLAYRTGERKGDRTWQEDDRERGPQIPAESQGHARRGEAEGAPAGLWSKQGRRSALLDWICLLYTSDAADERSSVDLGG